MELSDNGVIISEKLGKLLNIQAGDTIQLKDADNRVIEATVEGLTENYVYHYVYMSDALYQSLFGEEPSINALYGQLNDTTDEAEDSLSESLLQSDTVSSVSFNTAIRANFDDMISALNIVTVILILSAAALAFIVLFSLTNINIDERRRELATLKVLGFYDKETAMYLYRENIILTLMGIAAGLLMGVFLLRFVITTTEIDIVLFTRLTKWTNYAVSSLITLAFSLAVNLFMNRTIRRIDMVESMKSVE